MPSNFLKKHQLESTDKRQKTVLVFAGTGINFWTYLPLFNEVTTQELSEFKGIYSISGGSGPVWLHCHKHEGRFRDDLLLKFDNLFRRSMNRKSLPQRILSCLGNEYIYEALSLRNLMKSYLDPHADAMKFKDLEIKNFHVIAYDQKEGSYRLYSEKDSPNETIADIIAHAATPDRIMGRRLVKRQDRFAHITDFDFAPREVKKQLYRDLSRFHPDCRILYFNLSESKHRDQWEYIAVADTKLNPGIRKFLDLALVFLNIPNKSYKNVLSNVKI